MGLPDNTWNGDSRPLSALELRGAMVKRPTKVKRRKIIEGEEKRKRGSSESRRRYQRAYQRKWQKQNPEKYQAALKKYRRSAKGKAAIKRYRMRYYAKHAERERAKARAYWHNVRKWKENQARMRGGRENDTVLGVKA